MVSDKAITLLSSALGLCVGTVFIMPGVMCFDAGNNTAFSMKLLGVSSLLIIPTTIVATTAAIAFGCLKPLNLYLVPVVGIGVAILLDKQRIEEETRIIPCSAPIRSMK